MKILILDDMDDRHTAFQKRLIGHELVHAYTYDEGIIELTKAPASFDAMFLDHDLSLDSILCDPTTAKEPTGSTFAQFLVDSYDPAQLKQNLGIFLHSLNPAGRANMWKILRSAGFDAQQYLFTEIVKLNTITFI